MLKLITSCLVILFIGLGDVSAMGVCNAEWCDPSHEPYPNIVSVMTGYNILKGNPFVRGRTHDPGFATGYIMQPTYKTVDGRYALESGITVRQSVQCSISEDMKTVTTVKGYKDTVGRASSSKKGFHSNQEAEVSAELKGVGIKTTIPPLIDAAFSASDDYKNTEQFFTTKKGVLTINDATCSTYTVRISPYDPPPFTTGFMFALNALNNSLTSSQRISGFSKFIGEFGTHYLKQTTMGSRMAISRRYSQKEYMNTNDNAIKKCNSERLNLNMAARAGVSKESTSCKAVSSTANSATVEGFKREYITSYGSKPARDLVDWAKQKFDTPLPIKMELSPLLNLFTKAHFKKHPTIDYKRILRWIGPMYYDFCEKNKAQLSIKSCRPETQDTCGWNDNCVRRQQFCNNNKYSRGYTCCNPKCRRNPCKNGGVCNDDTSKCSYQCRCKLGWTGNTCTIKVFVKSILEKELKEQMRLNAGKSNVDFAKYLKEYLVRLYPAYYFTVDSYGQANGWDSHAVKGYAYVAIFRQHNRNLVVGFARRNSRYPSKSKMDDIEKQVVNAVYKKARSARTSMQLGWNKAVSFGYPISMVHVVRFGNGLRSSWNANTRSENLVVQRACDWLNRCTDHKSTIIIMFGSP